MKINLTTLVRKLRRFDAAKRADFDPKQGFDGDECRAIEDELGGGGCLSLADQIIKLTH